MLCCCGFARSRCSEHSLGSLDPDIQGEVEPSSAWLLWKTGHRAWTEAAPTATTSQLGDEAPLEGMGRRMDVWDWSQHHVVSGCRTPGTSTEGRQAGCEISMSDSPPEMQGACLLLECRSRLLLNDATTPLGVQLCRPLQASDVVWFGPRQYTLAEQRQHTLDQELPQLALARSASQEAQQCRGLEQTSWLELLLDSVALVWNAASAPFDKAGFFLGAWRLRRSSWTTTIAPTASSWRHI